MGVSSCPSSTVNMWFSFFLLLLPQWIAEGNILHSCLLKVSDWRRDSHGAKNKEYTERLNEGFQMETACKQHSAINSTSPMELQYCLRTKCMLSDVALTSRVGAMFWFVWWDWFNCKKKKKKLATTKRHETWSPGVRRYLQCMCVCVTFVVTCTHTRVFCAFRGKKDNSKDMCCKWAALFLLVCRRWF